MDVDRRQVSGSGDALEEVTERVGPSNNARPTVRMQFNKTAGDNNLASDSQRLGKLRVGTGADKVYVSSTSFALPNMSKKNNVGSNPSSGATDGSQLARVLGGNSGSSSSWLPTLQRNASAK
ncbi:hypothetical protein KSP40_PGU020702 [Platanthera guangdongensis]